MITKTKVFKIGNATGSAASISDSINSSYPKDVEATGTNDAK
jgi:hypothetical protein